MDVYWTQRFGVALPLVNWLRAIWDVISSPHSTATLVPLLIGWGSTVVASFWQWWNFRRVLEAKEERIKDLVEERNKFQDIVLKQVGKKRITTEPEKDKDKGKGKGEGRK